LRLSVLDSGHRVRTKVLFAAIRAFSRQPVLDVVKQVKYRLDFYGVPMQKVTHEAVRGSSKWSVADRELMAAYVSKMNECEFCVKAHTPVAVGAGHDEARVSGTLAELDTATIEESLKATLRLLGKLTREHAVDA
jgi:AhpD family alkylhydroperoxidase